MNPRSEGLWCAVGAYLLWGILPVYWKWLRHLAAPEILAHRITWSCLFLALLLTIRKEWTPWRKAASAGSILGRYAVAALLLAVNWGIYIWSVNTDQIVEASLGYYINPLVSVMLGTVFLGERLRRVQWLAVVVATVGVVYLTVQQGRLPWIALALAASFGLYGLTKKLSPLDAVPGLALETAVLGPVAIGYLVWLGWSGIGALGHAGWGVTGLLLFAGVVTSLPLLLFARAARTVHLTTLGILQYLSPSCALLLGVVVYHEPFPNERAFGFVLIWLALAVFSVEGLLRSRIEGRRQEFTEN